jgi:hypothetical protein
MKKLAPLSLLSCVVLLLIPTGQCYSQDFWKGKIISNNGNSPRVYSLVDGSIYKFNSGSKAWEKRGAGPTGLSDFPELQLDDRGFIWGIRSDGTMIYSKDEGTTWDVFGKNPAGYASFFKIVGDYVYSSGFVDGTSKVYRRKADASTGWQVIMSGESPDDITVTANGDIYLSVYLMKVFKSANNGTSWTNTGGPDYKFNSSPAFLTSIGNKVFVGTYWDGVYYTDDGGTSWKKSTGFPTGQPTINGSRGVSRIVIRNETDVFALVKDQSAVFGWYKSADGGQSFQPMNFPFNRWVVRWLDEMGLSGNDLIVSSDYRGFFHTSNDGASWTEANNGVNNVKPHHVSRMMKNSSGDLFALMSTGIFGPGPGNSWGILKSTDNGGSWVQVDDQVEDEYNTLEDLLVARNGHLYVTTYKQGTYLKSQDNGVTWQKNTITGGSFGSPSTITMIREVGLDSILIASYFNNLWRTYDGGATWTERVIKPSSGVMSFDTKGKTVYAISKDQVNYNGLYKSTDLGDTWTKINVNGTQKFDRIKIYGTSLFATVGTSLYRSDDDGVNWTNITPVIEGNNYITCLEIVETTTSGGRTQAVEAHLLLGTFAGLYSRSLQSTEWKKTENGSIYSVSTSGNQVFVGTETGSTVEVVAEAIKTAQSISFSSLSAKTIGDASFQISASASSGLPVTFTSSNLAVATISGGTVTVVGAGTTQIIARQAGNATISAAPPASRVLVVSKKTQTISFNAISAKDVNDAPFAITATSSSGLPVSFSSDNSLVATVDGNMITIKGLGSARITASQGGDNTFGMADPVTRELTVVAKANQTITFSAIPDKTVGDPNFGLAASSTSNLPVAFTTVSDRITIAGSQVTLVKPGRVIVIANQPGNDSYNAAPPVEQSFCIRAAKPTITVSTTPSETPTLTSSAPSGNQWYKDGSAIAGATGNTLVATSVGVYKVQVKVDDCVSEFSSDLALIVTGVFDGENSVLAVYPNPVGDYVEVRGIAGEPGDTRLYDLTGRIIPLLLERRDDAYHGDVRHLSHGIYLLRIQQGNSVRQVKLFKK